MINYYIKICFTKCVILICIKQCYFSLKKNCYIKINYRTISRTRHTHTHTQRNKRRESEGGKGGQQEKERKQKRVGRSKRKREREAAIVKLPHSGVV